MNDTADIANDRIGVANDVVGFPITLLTPVSCLLYPPSFSLVRIIQAPSRSPAPVDRADAGQLGARAPGDLGAG